MRRVIKPSEPVRKPISEYVHAMLDGFEELDLADPVAILNQARSEAEQKVREAYAEGLRRGQAAGEKQFAESVARAGEMLAEAAAALREERRRFIESLAPQVVRLALGVSMRILRREASLSEDVVTSTVRAALAKLADQERIVLRVHPQDLAALRAKRVTLLDEFEGVGQIDLVPDETVGPGGCVAETPRVLLDGRLDRQLEEILDQLLAP